MQVAGFDLTDVQLLAVAALIALAIVAMNVVAPPAALLLALLSCAVGTRLTLRASRASRS